MQGYHELKSHLRSGNRDTVSALLIQMVSHGIPADQQALIPKIHKIAKHAQALNLLNEEGLAAAQKIAQAKRLTYEKSFTFTTREGKVEVSRALIKKNSTVLRELIKDIDADAGINVDLSQKTVEFLKKCLHSSEILLPDDPTLIQELLVYLAGYGFDSLLQKLEMPLFDLLCRSNSILEEAWLKALCSVRQSHPDIVADCYKTIMHSFIDKFNEIPVYMSFVKNYWEVPLRAFFDEKTRDVVQYLPLAYLIKDAKELNNFARACFQNKTTSVIPLTVHCQFSIEPKKQGIVKKIAETYHIRLTLKTNVLPSGTSFFGKEHWDKHFGKVKDLPLPEGMATLLDSEIIFKDGQRTGKKWKDLFLLFLLPKKVDEIPLTLNLFRSLLLVQNPVFAKITEQHGETPVEYSRWMLLSKQTIQGTRGDTHDLQLPRVEQIPDCGAPSFLAAYVGYTTNWIETGKNWMKHELTVCKETTRIGIARKRIAFGGPELSLNLHWMKSSVTGLSALRVFKSQKELADDSKNDQSA